MKVSLNWLRDFVDIEVPIHELCDVLTNLGLEVSDVEVINENVKGIVASKIDEVEVAPDDEDMFICSMITGKERLTCLSRSPGLQKGLIVPLALPGAILQDGTRIEVTNFGTRESQGMMISEKELGLEAESPTVLFLSDSEIKLGDNIINALKLKDHVMDIELTANRSDCLSIFGVAREIAAYYRLPLKYKDPDIEPYMIDKKPNIELSIVEKKFCPYYLGREIRDITILPSPIWMKRRLTALGLRPINNIVDITNYILLETGQPLHAFDSNLLKGGKVIVRAAEDKEHIILLDEQDIELTNHDHVIADAEVPIALAGVMGGEGSQINERTTDLFLECANFSPNLIRRTAKRFTISSDSSYRFERGIDPDNKLKPSERASELIGKLAGGKILKEASLADNLTQESKKIFLSVPYVSRLLGAPVEKKSIVENLENLHFNVVEDETGLIVSPPSFRIDVERDVDLIEEIARTIGYDKFEPELPVKSLTAGRISQRKIFENKIKDLLISCGLYETITITLINEVILEKSGLSKLEPYEKFISIKNPLNKEQSILRTTLLYNLLNCVKHNTNHHKKDVALFELSPVYFKNNKRSYIESMRLSGAILQGSERKNWKREELPLDFFYLKGIFERIFLELNIKNFNYKKDAIPFFRPGESAIIVLNEKTLGYFGRINPNVANSFEVTDNIYFFELDFDLLFDNSNFSSDIEELPRYPAITLDIALLVSENVQSDKLYRIILEGGKGIIEDVVLFDNYKGKPLPPGKKSVAFSIVYRSREKTLKFEEVEEIHNNILKKLEVQTGAYFRS